MPIAVQFVSSLVFVIIDDRALRCSLTCSEMSVAGRRTGKPRAGLRQQVRRVADNHFQFLGEDVWRRRLPRLRLYRGRCCTEVAGQACKDEGDVVSKCSPLLMHDFHCWFHQQ